MNDTIHDLPWPLPERPELRDRLVAAYSADRGYHDLRHLAEVLSRIAELGEADNTELVLAAWFHDAIYSRHSDDNEERSAQLALSWLSDINGVDADEVARLVRLTTTHRAGPSDRPGGVLCDADLAILAAPSERYTEYVEGVRKEYAALPDEEFRIGRLALLERLAMTEWLFHTDHGRQYWEPDARRNLLAEIQSLRTEL
jgi:predicted metal-dependent HD superfamily phosphohydrolase